MNIINAASHREWCETFSGRKFFPLAPRVEDVDPLDIAHSLAMQCRYNGHSRFFYSVATHCCVLGDYALQTTNDRQLALEALLHDASEAYCGDVVRPLKYRLDGFKAIEDRIQDTILRALRIEPAYSQAIKTLDSRII